MEISRGAMLSSRQFCCQLLGFPLDYVRIVKVW